ncbi:Non-catalytic module family EXPN, partial [Melampsora americana]
TVYSPSLGSCGRQNGNQDMIVAVSHTIYDSFWGGTNPNSNPICGKRIKATYGSNSIEVVVVDRCAGCSHFDLDFSPGAFSKLGSPDQGRLHGMQVSKIFYGSNSFSIFSSCVFLTSLLIKS